MAPLHSVPAGIGQAVRRFGPSLLRPAALLAAGWIPVRLVREAAAYCADGAGRTEGRAVRVAHQTGDLPGVPATPTYSFGQAALPGRQALLSGGAHI